MKLLKLEHDEGPDGPCAINVDYIVVVSPQTVNSEKSTIELKTNEEIDVAIPYASLIARLTALNAHADS